MLSVVGQWFQGLDGSGGMRVTELCGALPALCESESRNPKL